MHWGQTMERQPLKAGDCKDMGPCIAVNISVNISLWVTQSGRIRTRASGADLISDFPAVSFTLAVLLSPAAPNPAFEPGRYVQTISVYNSVCEAPGAGDCAVLTRKKSESGKPTTEIRFLPPTGHRASSLSVGLIPPDLDTPCMLLRALSQLSGRHHHLQLGPFIAVRETKSVATVIKD